jgi:hypothetical protein
MTLLVITFWLALQIPGGVLLGRLLGRSPAPRLVPVLARAYRRRRR